MRSKRYGVFLSWLFLFLWIPPLYAYTSGDISFDSPDLEVSYGMTGSARMYLSAFKNRQNGKDTAPNRHQFRWYSLGIPAFLRFSDGRLHTRSPFGGLTRITMRLILLHDAHRQALANAANEKYSSLPSRPVRPSQIYLVPLQKLWCEVLYRRKAFRGLASTLSSDATKLFFDFENQVDADIFEKGIAEGFPLKCRYQFQGFESKKATITIRLVELQTPSIKAKIFGKGETRYLTRQQATQLSSYLAAHLSINEEYELGGDAFEKNLLQKLLSLTESRMTTPQDFLTVIKHQYEMIDPSLAKSLTPDTVRKESQKLFIFAKTGTKTHLKTIKARDKENKTRNRRETEVNAGGSFLGISTNGSVKYVKENENAWKTNNKDEKDQLLDLNRENKDGIQWERDGDTIIPKTIDVHVLSKANFEKNFNIDWKKNVYSKKDFSGEFTLDSKESITPTQIATNEVLLLAKLTSIETQFNTLKKQAKQAVLKLEKEKQQIIFETKKILKTLQHNLQLIATSNKQNVAAISTNFFFLKKEISNIRNHLTQELLFLRQECTLHTKPVHAFFDRRDPKIVTRLLNEAFNRGKYVFHLSDNRAPQHGKYELNHHGVLVFSETNGFEVCTSLNKKFIRRFPSEKDVDIEGGAVYVRGSYRYKHNGEEIIECCRY